MHVSRSTRRGLTWVELVVVVGVIGVLIALLLPAVQTVREASRRAACIDNMMQLGTALHNYASRSQTFPAASHVTRDASGRITAVDGWSWVMQILPEMENRAVYGMVDMQADRPGDTSKPGVQSLLNTQIGELLCPSCDGPSFANPRASSGAIANYKATGATHWESLSVATADPQAPRYRPTAPDYHPDGAMYPGAAYKPADFKTDGTSRTIMITETTEPVAARWAVGSEATLVGLAPGATFAQPTVDGEVLPFFAPTGFDGKFADSRYALEARTYLDWDYDDPDDGPYLPGKNQGTCGPSSHHPGAVNALFVDANVQTVSTDIDPALYMFLITREAGDPTGEFFRF